MSNYIDISIPTKTNQMQYSPGAKCLIDRIMQMDLGDRYNVSTMKLSAHNGTHFDAPYHFINDGKKISDLGPEHFFGKAKVLDFTDKEASITRQDIEKHTIEKGDIILIKTKNSEVVLSDDFIEDYVFLEGGAAAYLAEKGIHTLGFDFLSVDSYHDDSFPVHYALLGAGIAIIEGLVLKDIVPGEYEIAALPLNILNGDGAPARVMIRPLFSE